MSNVSLRQARHRARITLEACGLALCVLLLPWVGGVDGIVGDVPYAYANGTSDQAIAEAGTLTIGDFGPGWIERAPMGELPIEATTATIPECRSSLQAVFTATKKLPQSVSANFINRAEVVNNGVYVFPTVRRARATLRSLRSAQTKACTELAARQLLDSELAKAPSAASQIANVDIEVDRERVDAVGDEVVTYASTASITAKNGQRSTSLSESWYVRVGRVLSTYTFTSPSATGFPLAPKVAPNAIALSLSRL